ncbi:MAG: hypothetical protein U0X87_01830 [Anaerolineales bacterium]
MPCGTLRSEGEILHLRRHAQTDGSIHPEAATFASTLSVNNRAHVDAICGLPHSSDHCAMPAAIRGLTQFQFAAADSSTGTNTS